MDSNSQTKILWNNLNVGTGKAFEPWSTEIKLLVRHGNTFVMDNHLAASWCWLQCCSSKESYKFVHIDRHPDLCYPGLFYGKEINWDSFIGNDTSASLNRYLNTSWNHYGSPEIKLFQWNNYISLTQRKYSDWFSDSLFIIKGKYEQDDNKFDNNNKIRFILGKDFAGDLEEYLKNSKDGSCILNLDIDYFFMGTYWDDNNSDKINCKYDDSEISNIGMLLEKYSKKYKVVTIALSPECCGGIKESLRVFNILRKEMSAMKEFNTDLSELYGP